MTMKDRGPTETRTFIDEQNADGSLDGREWAARIEAAANDIPRRYRPELVETYQKPWG